MKLRKGDTVKVLSGNDKGKTGEILEVIPKTEKIIVKGINIRKKSVKPRRQGEQGGIIPSEFSIHSRESSGSQRQIQVGNRTACDFRNKS